MLKNYFKIALRQLFKNKTFSFINIFGLAVGMAAFILLALWIKNEVSYDKFHSKKNRIYNLWNKAYWGKELMCWEVTPKVASLALREHFPEIEKVARVDWPQNRLLNTGNKKLFSNGNVVDPEFLDLFDFPLIMGDRESVFKDPNSIVITSKLSEKLFGNDNPIGKVIKVENQENLTVTGIVSNPPNNTRFNFEYLIPWKFITKKGEEQNWNDNSTRTYVLVNENASIDLLQNKIKNLRKNFGKTDDVYDMFLYPMERWRLYSNFKNGVETGGKIELVRLFSIIAAFILLIACINFMNLSTARSEKRAKEVGIRKTVGAARVSLIKQFLSETVILSIFGFLIAILLVQLSLPAYNQLVQKNLSINYSSPWFWLSCVFFVLFTGVLAGSYPALYLSAFNPVKVLKGTFRQMSSVVTPRKVLVVLQFVFAITLIISTIIIKQQITYALNRENGYDKKQLAYHFLSNDLEKNYETLKNELIAQKLVKAINRTSSPVTQGWSDSWGFIWDGKDPNDKTDFDRFFVDQDLVKTIGVNLVQGRDFNLKEFSTDSSAVILNESALKAMNLKNPLGKIIKDGDTPFHVIGVIKDFIMHSPFQPTKPMVIMGAKGWFNVINIRLNDEPGTLKKVENVFKKYNPEYPFDLNFIDQEYIYKFDDINRMASLSWLFAGLTIFISCLGLFGLASYMAENRIKEIGIRKVLGASVTNITGMLSVNFITLVIIAFVLATPLAYWLLNNWLKDFQYRITIQWWVFLAAGLLSVIISAISVAYQSIKAAVSNPIKSLRTE